MLKYNFKIRQLKLRLNCHINTQKSMSQQAPNRLPFEKPYLLDFTSSQKNKAKPNCHTVIYSEKVNKHPFTAFSKHIKQNNSPETLRCRGPMPFSHLTFLLSSSVPKVFLIG